MKLGILSSRPHKNLSVSVIVPTVVFIKKKKNRYLSICPQVFVKCLRSNSNLPFFVTVFANFFYQFLLSCPQKSVDICHRVHKIMSMSSLSTKKSVNVCHRVNRNLPFDSKLDTSQPQYLIVLFRIYFPFLVTSSLEFFRPHSLCVSFLSFYVPLHSHPSRLRFRNHVNLIAQKKSS